MSRALEVFEHGKLRVSSSADGISQQELEALVRFNDRHQGQYFDVGYKHLKVKSFVGYLEVGDLSIEILPKADREAAGEPQTWRAGLLEMLRVALGLRLHTLPSAGQQIARSQLLDLIARAYVNELQPLLHEGLAKGYRTTQSNGTVFRGRLKMGSHLRDNLVHGERFFVEYQTFDHQIIINQVLAAALKVLSRRVLSPGVAGEVKACFSRLSELVAEVGGDGLLHQLARLRLTRATQRYARALTYARMILAQHGPQLRNGSEQVFALLFDMNALWELYVATLLRRVAPTGMAVCVQERHLLWEAAGHRARRVRPDLVVRESLPEGGGRVLAVIDTKWKVPEGLPADADLQQMFVYNELLGASRSILLYPRTARSAEAAGGYSVRSSRAAHSCEQRYVGLVAGSKWSNEAIRIQLAELLSGIAASEASVTTSHESERNVVTTSDVVLR
jgi:5-methylcytosine-specific restriction enzyme subunit McrC